MIFSLINSVDGVMLSIACFSLSALSLKVLSLSHVSLYKRVKLHCNLEVPEWLHVAPTFSESRGPGKTANPALGGF
jgi:hypothetical protein